MARVRLAILMLFSVCGCGSFRQQTVDYPCDDCLPPPIAGTFKYHRKIDNLVTTLTAQRCAKRDLKQIRDECGEIGRDYKSGYTQAYIDLAAGRPACVPAVPPAKYWHAWHRSCAGADAVDEWYAGYRTGLDYGINGGVNHFNRIIPSPEGCCVSAAYVSPYATAAPPNAVVPLNRQVITREDGPPTQPEGLLPASDQRAAGVGEMPSNSASYATGAATQFAP